jgi:hypothetical protein
MIVYNLRCAKDHVFEAWFRDSTAYDDQAAAGEVECPSCGSSKITKAPMAPNIATSRETKPDGPTVSAKEVMTKLRELRTEVEKNSDHVGEKFPEEARKIHYGEAEKRNIHGDATADEARELSDEGVEFGVIPWVPRTDS